MDDFSTWTTYYARQECQKHGISCPGSRANAIKTLQNTTDPCENHRAQKRQREYDRMEYMIKDWEMHGHHLRELNAKYATAGCCDIIVYTMSVSCTMEIETTVVTIRHKTVQEIEADLIHPDMHWKSWIPGDDSQTDWIQHGINFANKQYKKLW